MRVTKKNSKWPKKQKSDFKDSLHTFSKSGPSAGKAGVTSLFMQAIFSAGGPLFFGGGRGRGWRGRGFWEARGHSVHSHGQGSFEMCLRSLPGRLPGTGSRSPHNAGHPTLASSCLPPAFGEVT